MGHTDRYHRTVTNVNNPGTSHNQYCRCRFQIPRRQGETRLPFRRNGMYRLLLFGRWNTERL